jgi:hypothetical protein
MSRSRSLPFFTLALLAFSAAGGCAHNKYVSGTTIAATEENQALIGVIERYRLFLQEKDVDGILLLASERYFEDSGTPRADDDYGYDKLKDVLSRSFGRVRSLRYDIQYRNVRVSGDRAEVEVFLNGAFELVAEGGERYRRVSDYHRFVLERSDDTKWKFVAGL